MGCIRIRLGQLFPASALVNSPHHSGCHWQGLNPVSRSTEASQQRDELYGPLWRQLYRCGALRASFESGCEDCTRARHSGGVNMELFVRTGSKVRVSTTASTMFLRHLSLSFALFDTRVKCWFVVVSDATSQVTHSKSSDASSATKIKAWLLAQVSRFDFIIVRCTST